MILSSTLKCYVFSRSSSASSANVSSPSTPITEKTPEIRDVEDVALTDRHDGNGDGFHEQHVINDRTAENNSDRIYSADVTPQNSPCHIGMGRKIAVEERV